MLGGTIVVGQDEAPLGGDAEHRPGLVKGKLVGAAGAPRLACQLEGWHMVRIHPIVRQAEQEALGSPDLLAGMLSVI